MIEERRKLMPDFLTSDSQLGDLIRHFDWASTSLGPISSWSQSLKTTINLMLNSKNPIWIGWGPENIFLYNDSYIDVLGIDKHPWALGKPAYIVWEEIWDFCGPLSDKVYNEGISSSGNDVQLFMKRGDFLEEVYYSFSYSPVFDESGKVGGLFCPNFETTAKILNVRRSRTLSELAAKSLVEKTISAACASASQTLAKNTEDIPFAVFYLMDKSGKNLDLIQKTGLSSEQAFFSSTIDPEKPNNLIDNTLADVINSSKSQLIKSPSPDVFTKGLAGQDVKTAVAFPLIITGSKPSGVLVCGINPTRRLDEEYFTFFEMVSAQVAAAIQNATAIETERRRLEELAELDRAKTAFFSNISHEFRTPLTLMLGPLEDLLQNHSFDQKETVILETTHRNALRLLRLVNTLLDFSLMESGRMKAKFVPTDIATLTINLAANFRSVIEKAGMRFNVEAASLNEPAYIDRQMWEKIIFNLLSNAFKYTMQGSINLKVSREGNNVVLSISDTGVGIPEKELPNMFTRFHRIQNSTGRSFEGSGIGLSMIKEFVLQHGGEIFVESTEGKGSVFTVSLPLGNKHLPQDQIFENEFISDDIIPNHFIAEANAILKNEAGNEINVIPESVSNDIVLIVDDNADMRMHLKSIVEHDYNTVTAQNGAEALEKISQYKISLVLSDVMMPVMDGIQLLKELKSNSATATIPVILLTARAGEESRIEGYETGADDYLVKPFSAKELTARIRSQIKISKTKDHIQQQLKNLFMQAPIAICILKGEDFVVEMANDNILEMWSKPESIMLNRPLFEGLPEAKDQGFDKLLLNVYHTGKVHVDDECPFYKIENGIPRQIYVKFIYQPYYEENGIISGIIVLAHDVTQQVEARKKIEDSELKFRNLIRQAPMGITILKGEDLVVDIANDAYLKIRNKTREQLIGKKLAEAIPEIKGSAVEQNLISVFHSGKSKTFTDLPAEIITNSIKEMRYFNSIYQPLIEGDKVTGVITVVSEVTEQFLARKIQERNEKDLKLILEALPHIAFRSDPEGLITYYNNKYYEYTGLTFDEAKGNGWKPAIHPDMLEQVSAGWTDAMESGKEYENTFLVKRAYDQAYRWHLGRAVALRNDSGEITQWIGTLTDIHEQKIFAEKLEAMVNDRTERLNKSNRLLAEKNIELEKTNKDLESFNYVASHDLQEPLRKIRTFINLIKDKGQDGNAEYYFSKIDSSAERMSQLIQAILTYSRLSTSGDEFETVSLDSILRQVLIDYELIIQEKNVKIKHDILPALKCIPLQMNQLFSNLISNSLKYSSHNPEIQITYKIVNAFDIKEFQGADIDRKYAEIKFKDNGIGFDEKYSEQIFKLFQRLHGKSEYSGTGIGLSICKKIVEQHNGYISAESTPGKGAVFTVHLPM